MHHSRRGGSRCDPPVPYGRRARLRLGGGSCALPRGYVSLHSTGVKTWSRGPLVRLPGCEGDNKGFHSERTELSPPGRSPQGQDPGLSQLAWANARAKAVGGGSRPGPRRPLQVSAGPGGARPSRNGYLRRPATGDLDGAPRRSPSMRARGGRQCRCRPGIVARARAPRATPSAGCTRPPKWGGSK